MKNTNTNNRVIVIGAGPVGISAAAQLIARGLEPLLLEKGSRVGHAILEWGHVRVFTPWQYITDKAVMDLLEPMGWKHPDKKHLPTGQEIVDEYLVPAAEITALKNHILYDANVVAVSKLGLSKSSTLDRNSVPFTVHYKTSDREHNVIEAMAVIDASGTWYNPNPIGADGLMVPGEQEFSDRISYGIPETLTRNKALYEGKKTLVLGSGHSAINVVLDVLQLKKENADTKLIWGLRRNKIEKLLGGGINDKLPARSALGTAAKEAIDDGALELYAPMNVRKISKIGCRMNVEMDIDDKIQTIEVDRIIVATGFHPNLEMLREIRLDLDVVVEAPNVLAPMIDPNFHSCGTVRPHGIDELSHTDKNFFIVGMKAYGRAPTFLMKTGYEQVRSIADELAGNHEAARKIELDLPQTGVCSSRPQISTSTEPLAVSSECCEIAPVEKPPSKECCDSTPITEKKPEVASGKCCGPAPTHTAKSNWD
ncbi:NAD(P)-binding domain-containing protein [Kiloniella antarctica]|uniref:NAD(P)-binding domain-containing protein n=1 Tax=Kiloniella antarctica TaxID=1550907 RepID=A0ABW5BSM3_9PROT